MEDLKYYYSKMNMFVYISSILSCLNSTTNDDGRCPGLITKQLFTAGVYKMRFETAQYWASMGETCFYPYVEVRKGLKCYMMITSSAVVSGVLLPACSITIFLLIE